MSFITQDLIQEVLQKYNTKKDMATALQISMPTLNSYLKKYNLSYTKKVQHPEITKEWLQQNWVETSKSIHTLAEEFHISESLLEARILKFKLTKKYKYKINLDKLFNLNDPHIWYLAGLFATDGCFSKKHDFVSIELVGDSEYDLLLNIKQYYESSQPVKHYFHQDKTFHTDGVHTNYWQISADNLKNFFMINFGITLENKTWNVGIPAKFPTENCAKAYIRGCLDGDGYIARDNPYVTLCTASEVFVQGIGEIVKQYTGINYRLAYTPRSNGRKFLEVSWKTQRAHQLLTWVYSLEDCFRLERKYQRFLEFYQIKNTKDV